MTSRKYQAYSEFSAQSHTVHALMSMYSLVQSGSWKRRPLTPIVVFIAFAIESYINSIGARKISFWTDIERLPWKRKINVLHSVAGQPADWSTEPLQFAAEVFHIRDKLAHGRAERVVGQMTPDRTEALRESHGDELKPAWLSPIDAQWIDLSQGRFRRLMIHLSELFGLHESDHLLLATGGVQEHDAYVPLDEPHRD